MGNDLEISIWFNRKTKSSQISEIQEALLEML